MTNSSLRLGALLGFTCLYSLLFFGEKAGVNVLVFSSLLSGAILWSQPRALKSKSVWVLALGSFLTADLVVVHNSGAAFFAHWVSMVLFVGFVHVPELRSVFWGGAAFVTGYFRSIGKLLRDLPSFHPWMHRQLRLARVSLIPLGVMAVFYFLFRAANPRFAMMSDDLLSSLTFFLEQFGVRISWGRLFFTLIGFCLLLGVFYPGRLPQWIGKEHSWGFSLFRKKTVHKRGFTFPALRKENRAGVLSMGLVNLLLLVNNLLDIDWIWLNFTYTPGFNLSQFVHEGTYLLILSILLSMGIMLYFFRGNQNFFRENPLLRRLAYLWIAQNVILVISVALRNWHYIAVYGLTYKRIGVIMFLLLTLFGLATLFLKIRERRSAFFLVWINGWAVYGLLLFLAMVNWDASIARFNLSRPLVQDKAYLLELSDRALPVLLTHASQFSDKQVMNRRGEVITYREFLERRVNRFIRKRERHSWLSWNLADRKVTKALKLYDFGVVGDSFR